MMRSLQRRMLAAVLGAAATLATLPAQAEAGLQALDAFLKGVRSARADFTQVVTAPPREGQRSRTKNSSGSFEMARPGRFRFVYRKPFEQTLVADGESLWLYDPDLQQVTVRKQAAVLGATPAALVASAADLRALERDFSLKDGGAQDGLAWVVATPLAREGTLQSVRVGFAGTVLERLEILDSFGQTSVLRFAHWQPNLALPASTFHFQVPAGVTVVRQ